MKLIYFTLSLFLTFSQYNVILSKSVKATVVYFPDPKNEGKLIPAFLDGPRRAGNESDVHFYLITRNNPQNRDELFIGDLQSLQNSHFIPNAPLKVMSHGFGGSANDHFPAEMAQTFLQHENCNIVLIDFSVMAESPWYNIAAASVKMVAQQAAKLINFMIEQNLASLDNTHVIGYSLGCHVVGNIGGELGGKCARITALDPALPLFDVALDSERIDPTDAQFVDVVHTAGGYLWENGLSMLEPRGHVDFYPNTGRLQPGCEGETFGSCSHGRAVDYFTETFKDVSGFPGCKCEVIENFLPGACDCSDKVFLGISTPSSARGSYYFRTSSSRPYALGENGLMN